MKKPKVKPIRQLYTFDNLPVLRRLDSESVDLIYLDPPFNSGKQWENPIEAGGKKALASFKDTWNLSDIHVDEAWSLGRQYRAAIPLIDSLYKINGGSWKAYLIYMGVRLAEMRRILKPTGSIYFHCDPVMSHGVKLLMDVIFGKKNFQNEIVWYYYNKYGAGKRVFGRNYDQIFFYSKNERKYHFSPLREERDAPVKQFVREVVDGVLKNKRDEKGNLVYRMATDKKVDAVWRMPCLQPASKQYTGYPTQKPLALLDRIITASSEKGGVVLDPFCGCATTCVAAERLGRQWIGIDLSEEAKAIVLERLTKETELPLTNPENVVEYLSKLPKRTDLPKRTPDNILKPELHDRQGGRCVAPCGDEVYKGIRLGRKVDMDLMDFDHITALARGGNDVDGNLQLLCRACNSLKGSGGMERLRRLIFRKKEQEERAAAREEWEKEFADEN